MLGYLVPPIRSQCTLILSFKAQNEANASCLKPSIPKQEAETHLADHGYLPIFSAAPKEYLKTTNPSMLYKKGRAVLCNRILWWAGL